MRLAFRTCRTADRQVLSRNDARLRVAPRQRIYVPHLRRSPQTGSSTQRHALMLSYVVSRGMLPLVELNLLESQPLQQTHNRGGGVLLGVPQNAVGHGGLLQLTFRLLADLR